MGKMTYYVLLISGLVLLFNFAGLTTDCQEDGLCEGKTPNSHLLTLVLKPENMQELSFGDKLFLMLEGVTALVGGIALAVATRDASMAIVVPFTIYLANLLWDGVVVFQTMWKVSPYWALLLCSPMLVLLIVTTVEWFRGND